MKDIQWRKADGPDDRQAPKNPDLAMPEGLRRERKPPYDREKGYRDQPKQGTDESK
jgi:hypothetical protein